MNGRTLVLALAVLTVSAIGLRPARAGTVSTPIQTQTIGTTLVDWGPGTPGLGNPMAFSQFNSSLGTLTGVAITFSATIQNNFILGFDATPIPTTLYVATTNAADPSVLANPTLSAQLTDGPSVTLGGPGGTTIFGGSATTLPVDVVSLTEPSGTFSSLYAITNPNYLAPDNATISLSTTLNASNDASLFSQFIGTGSIDLPVTAVAHSSFYSNSGNGSGAVLTDAGATVTIQYFYTPASPIHTGSVPEPSGLVLLTLGAGIGLAAAARRRSPRAIDPRP